MVPQRNKTPILCVIGVHKGSPRGAWTEDPGAQLGSDKPKIYVESKVYGAEVSWLGCMGDTLGPISHTY